MTDNQGRVRVAMLGLGGIAQSVHLPLLQRNRENIDVVALVDLSRAQLERFGPRYGIDPAHCYTHVSQLTDDIDNGNLEIDAAIIATGGTHVDDVAALGSRGVKVLVEKPLGYSHQELDRLDQALAKAGHQPTEAFRVGYMKEHDPASIKAKELIAETDVRAIHVTILHPADGRQLEFARLAPRSDDLPSELLSELGAVMADDVASMIGDVDETAQKYFTNVFLGSIIHDIALTRFLGHPIDTVTDVVLSGDAFPGSITAHGKTTTGVPWFLSWHFIDDYPVYRETLEYHHNTGSIELEFATPYILQAPTKLTVTSGGDDLSVSDQLLTWPQSESFEQEHRRLIALVSGKPEEGSCLDEARDDLEVAHKMWRAAHRTDS